MSTPHSVRYEAFKLTKSHKRKPTGAEAVIGDVMALITGLNALGLDGYQLVVGNNANDLPPEGGFWEAEIGSSVTPLHDEQLRAVSPAALVAAVPSAPATLKDNFLALQQFYGEAAKADAGINMFPVAD